MINQNRPIKIGFTGAHRTGKTTLAKRLAVDLRLPYVPSISSKVYQDIGIDPSKTPSFSDRLNVQNRILTAQSNLWESQESFVTDRTPYDFVMYLLADINNNINNTTELAEGFNTQEIVEYITYCQSLCDSYFSNIILVEPAIDLVPEAGKANSNQLYIDHLNALIKGLTIEKANVKLLPKNIVELDSRVNWVKNYLFEVYL